MAHLVHNERTKLISTFLNNLGVAIMAGGVFIPLISSGPGLIREYSIAIAFIGIFTGVFFLGLGVHYLKDLKE